MFANGFFSEPVVGVEKGTREVAEVGDVVDSTVPPTSCVDSKAEFRDDGVDVDIDGSKGEWGMQMGALEDDVKIIDNARSASCLHTSIAFPVSTWCK